MTTFNRFSSATGLARMAALALAFGGAALPAAAATFDMAIEEHPCEVVTAQMIATALDVPADNLEQSHFVTSQCDYEMDGDNGDIVNVEVALESYETDAEAADYFRQYTRSMSLEEIAEATRAIRDAAEDLDDAETGEAVTSVILPQGIQFEDVEGVADQARFEVSDGTLHMQQGNLLIKLRAFHGPDMPIPDEITSESMIKAVSDWQKDTMPERRQQALALAKLVLADL